MINSAGLQIIYDAWVERERLDKKYLSVSDNQLSYFVLAGGVNTGPARLEYPGQTAFIYLVESNEFAPGSTVPPIISVTSSTFFKTWKEWFPGLPPLQFVSPVCICDEFFSVDVDNKLAAGVAPSGAIEVSVHYLLASYSGPKRERIDLI